ncbi:sensor histidine kinase [Arcicella lustrica]|uniref:Histidine kinase n=1 Tax=Arcicella lustrica TaxID=2984196 RepID=A0ABU5SD23_9BACT|nr:histidine kinase [Arcicella sp. DC25W]MEA5425195.1 histidine kinase [Arcicella sp. DC25W]
MAKELKSSFWGRFWLLSFFTVMAFNGHIYFIIGIIRGKNQYKDFIINIIYSNIYDATMMIGLCWLFIQFGSFSRFIWVRHGILSLCTMLSAVLKFFSFSLLYKFFEDDIPTKITNYSRDNYDALFVLGPLLGANIIYYWFTHERTRLIKMTEQEYQLLQLNDLKIRAELEALEAKINPHFLYNSLNSIASLVHDDPDKAEHMVLNLSKFYRYSTGRSQEHYDTLENELEIVKTYLEIEKIRFDERLIYTVEFEDEAFRKYKIPRFLLQPIIENAIKHGISKIAGQGVLKIKVSKEKENLNIKIFDNGVPFPDNIFSGYGLKSIQDKLRLLSGETASMELTNSPEKVVIISLPVSSV